MHSTKAELLAVLMAACLWGECWRGQRILWRTDCVCHGNGLFKLRSKAPELLPIQNEIDFLQVKHGFAFSSEHIAGQENILAEERPARPNGLFLSRVDYPFLELNDSHHLITMLKVGLE